MELARQAGKMYDEFDKSAQDIPRSEFIKRYCAAMNPGKMLKDAENIITERRMLRSRMYGNKARIDRALNENR